MLRKVLLGCGILSSLLYVGADIAAALRWDAYSYPAQSISELMAVGAPTRPFIEPFFLAYNFLVMVFGVGVLRTQGAKPSLLAAGWLLLLYGILGFAGLLVFPLPPPGTEATASGAVLRHEIVTAVIVLCLMLIVVFGGAARGKGFLFYSIGTLLVVVLFGILTAMDVPLKEAHWPTPWLGIKERINVYSTMLWVAAFAMDLLNTRDGYGRSS